MGKYFKKQIEITVSVVLNKYNYCINFVIINIKFKLVSILLWSEMSHINGIKIFERFNTI